MSKHDLTLFKQSIMWIEYYIEAKGLVPNFVKQTDTTIIRRKWDKNTPESEILSTIGTSLHIGFSWGGKGKDHKSKRRKEEKNEFYKWINAAKIDNNCPKTLKEVLFAFHEVLESKEGGYKLHQSAENAKPEMDRDSPEYKKALQEVFSSISESHQSGKAFEVDNTEFNGNSEEGKKTFEAIANSLSDTERDNFHFWPQMSTEEKSQQDHQNEERNDQADLILQNCRASAISEITVALQKRKLNNADLSPQCKNWESKINQTEDIIEIMNIQNLVLTDIQKKKKTLLPPRQKSLQQFWQL